MRKHLRKPTKFNIPVYGTELHVHREGGQVQSVEVRVTKFMSGGITAEGYKIRLRGKDFVLPGWNAGRTEREAIQKKVVGMGEVLKAIGSDDPPSEEEIAIAKLGLKHAQSLLDSK